MMWYFGAGFLCGALATMLLIKILSDRFNADQKQVLEYAKKVVKDLSEKERSE